VSGESSQRRTREPGMVGRMQLSSEPSGVRAFGISDVLSDAFRSWRQRFTLHLGFNAVFVAVLLTSGCLVGCLFAAGMGTMVQATRESGSGTDAAVMVTVAILYLVMLTVFLIAFALHHAFTLEVTGSDLRGELPTFAVAFRRAGGLLHRHVGAAIIRVLIDFSTLCVTGGIVAVVAASRSTPDDAADSVAALAGEFAIVFVLVYVAQIVWVCGVRGFLGLTAVAVQLEGRGVFDAIRRSIDLLYGRRLQFIGLRIVWGLSVLAIIVVAYLPMIGLMLVGHDGTGATVFAVLLIPYTLAFYALILMLYSFDSALEAAYHARVVPSNVPAGDIAEVFG